MYTARMISSQLKNAHPKLPVLYELDWKLYVPHSVYAAGSNVVDAPSTGDDVVLLDAFAGDAAITLGSILSMFDNLDCPLALVRRPSGDAVYVDRVSVVRYRGGAIVIFSDK